MNATLEASSTENDLSPLAKNLLRSLKSLQEGYRPHSCGGFTTDDMQWRLGTAFTLDRDLLDAIDELTDRKLIRYAGFDDYDAIGHCYEAVKAEGAS